MIDTTDDTPTPTKENDAMTTDTTNDTAVNDLLDRIHQAGYDDAVEGRYPYEFANNTTAAEAYTDGYTAGLDRRRRDTHAVEVMVDLIEQVADGVPIGGVTAPIEWTPLYDTDVPVLVTKAGPVRALITPYQTAAEWVVEVYLDLPDGSETLVWEQDTPGEAHAKAWVTTYLTGRPVVVCSHCGETGPRSVEGSEAVGEDLCTTCADRLEYDPDPVDDVIECDADGCDRPASPTSLAGLCVEHSAAATS